jgi:hypothetical protein
MQYTAKLVQIATSHRSTAGVGAAFAASVCECMDGLGFLASLTNLSLPVCCCIVTKHAQS